MGIVFDRTFLLFVDYVLLALVGSWPKEFFLGSREGRRTGSAVWRWRIGVREKEIVVRRGRRWDTKILVGSDKKERVWSKEDELTMLKKVGDAMRKEYLAKTGVLLLDKKWDLEYRGMIDAHRMVDSERLKMEDLDGCVFVWYGEKWLWWRPNERRKAEGERDEKTEKFRKALEQRKCGDVFYRWIEIVQFETNQKKGTEKERYERLLEEFKRLLNGKRVDVDKLLKEVGGEAGVPGLG